MIPLDTFKKLRNESEGRLPLLTLDEFFSGNTWEDSLAPNQWGEGRPALEELWAVLQKAESLPYIAWIRVALHDDTEIEKQGEEESLTLCGDSIILCTAAKPSEIEALVDCAWLCSDGVIAVEDSELHVYSRIPPVPKGYRCVEIVWD